MHYQVAGVAGQTHIRQFTLCTRANVDHFEDILVMVCNGLTAVVASLAGALDHRQEVAVFGIIQHLGQLSRQPELVVVRVKMAKALKRVMVQFGNALTGHG
ncbi:MAG: hypothetical protein K9K38_06960 [Rhodoferax sp.]|nr:hypothetical protein [Rhodoferax sp.]